MYKRIKYILTILIFIITTFTLISCGSSNSSPQSPDNPSDIDDGDSTDGEPASDTLINASDYIEGLTILGGEPLHPRNAPFVYMIVKAVRNRYGGEKNIWVYTGYTYEEVRERCEDILYLIDVLVDGKFILEQKSLMLKFKGSANQRVIDVKSSLKANKIIELF